MRYPPLTGCGKHRHGGIDQAQPEDRSGYLALGTGTGLLSWGGTHLGFGSTVWKGEATVGLVAFEVAETDLALQETSTPQ